MTGASRGIGKGIALELGRAGAVVYLTGRSLEKGDSRWPGTITETSEEVAARGGVGIGVRCDHVNDKDVERLFQRVRDERDRLDVLVNNATSFGESPSSRGYDPGDVSFWELPISQWDEMLDVGLRSHYVASVFAARIMTVRRAGLIVNISSSGATRYS